MADKLLVERGAQRVGKNWPDNFIKRTPELKTQWSRSYDHQRALNEDSRVIGDWFKLVQSIKAKYGIQDEDSYNFDETGFMMGVISSQLVVTGSERRGKRKVVQPGNREWTTVIQGINAAGWAIPPFIIFAGKNHISSWYENNAIPGDWVIGVSENGWTTDELGVAWLKHFDAHTKTRTVGTHRLLIIDGHSSHNSLDFQEICKESNIITLCMPAHSSHLLQPLDVGCFSPLKRAYGDQICGLARNRINHITKLEFLAAFKAAFEKVFTKNIICSSFRGAGLVPFDPEAVLSKLDVQLRTPSPPAADTTLWESKTPRNLDEFEHQSTLIRNRIQRHQGSSPTSIVNSLDRLTKGAETMVHTIVLLRDQVARLEEANTAATKRKSRKRKYIQNQGTLTKEKGTELIAVEGASGQEEGKRPAKRSRAEGSATQRRRCGRCGKTGHNSRTCREEVIDTK